MRRLVLIVGASLGACRIEIDSPISVADAPTNSRVCKVSTTAQVCKDATSHADFAWIYSNILATNCKGSSCHETGSSSKAKNNPYDDQLGAHMNLVDKDALVNPGVKLVVANQPNQSYLLVMMQEIKPAEFMPPLQAPPTDVGFMPQAGGTLCCQKLDAVQRWIEAGAPND